MVSGPVEWHSDASDDSDDSDDTANFQFFNFSRIFQFFSIFQLQFFNSLFKSFSSKFLKNMGYDYIIYFKYT